MRIFSCFVWLRSVLCKLLCVLDSTDTNTGIFWEQSRVSNCTGKCPSTANKMICLISLKHEFGSISLYFRAAICCLQVIILWVKMCARVYTKQEFLSEYLASDVNNRGWGWTVFALLRNEHGGISFHWKTANLLWSFKENLCLDFLFIYLFLNLGLN